MRTTLQALAAGMLIGLVGFVSACGGGSGTPEASARAEVTPPTALISPGTLSLTADFQGPPFDYIDGTTKVRGST